MGYTDVMMISVENKQNIQNIKMLKELFNSEQNKNQREWFLKTYSEAK